MRTLVLTTLVILLFSACKKELINNLDQEEVLTSTEKSNITSNSQIQGQTPVFANICASVKGYLLKLPNDYSTTTKKYPLLVYLHGGGVTGNGTTDLYKITKNGVPELLQKGVFPEKFTVNGKTYKFLIVAPQFNINYMYAHDVNAVIEYVKKNYRVNTARIYLTGMSLGGGGTVSYCDSFATKLAAAVPMASCWPPPFESIAHAVVDTKLPLWVFHNKYDTTFDTPPSNSIDLVNLINSYSPITPAKITLFSSKDHNCWTKGYSLTYKENNLNIYQWMLQYQNVP